MMITFTVPTIAKPQPRQRHRIVTKGKRGYATNYTPTKDPVNFFKLTVRQVCASVYHGPPLVGNVCLSVVFVLPRPKALRWKTKPMTRQWHAKKPDLDNLLKALKDALTGLAWHDDAKVCKYNVSKITASGEEAPRVWVQIYELKGEVFVPI